MRETPFPRWLTSLNVHVPIKQNKNQGLLYLDTEMSLYFRITCNVFDIHDIIWPQRSKGGATPAVLNDGGDSWSDLSKASKHGTYSKPFYSVARRTFVKFYFFWTSICIDHLYESCPLQKNLNLWILYILIEDNFI